MDFFSIINLCFVAGVPVIVSVAVYIAEKKQLLVKLNYFSKQFLIGIIFGAVAIFSTENGVYISGATLNVRDASALSAGLIFGGPAGIIAGVIGGVERWFAALWGVGYYTRLACSLATIISGFFAALLRKLLFDNKKPSVFYGFFICLLMEIFHILLIFLTNMDDVDTAFTFVERTTTPLVLFNSVSVMFAVLFVSVIGREKINTNNRLKQIAQTFQNWLFVCVIVSLFLAITFSYVLQTRLAENSSESVLSVNIDDVKQDIIDASDANLLELTYKVADELDSDKIYTLEHLNKLLQKYDVSEINLVDSKGIITDSTVPDYIGYDLSVGDQSIEFISKLKETGEYVQSYRPISYDSSISRKYAGVIIDNGGFVQVGYDASRFQEDIDSQVIGVTKNRHVGENGYILICDEEWNIVSGVHGYEDQNLSDIGITIDTETIQENVRFPIRFQDNDFYCMYTYSEGYYIIAVLPKNEAVFSRNVSVYVTVFMEIVVFAILFMLVYFLVKRIVVENIRKINRSLAQISRGNLDVLVDVRTNEEFASLSDDINSTVMVLKHYIDEAASRIDTELEFARSIQYSALPSVFPPYPNRDEFDIYAKMVTAKEVGGDFYDFYLVGEDKLVFLIADVSGKGIPAAMFMMTAKTVIKSFAETGMEVDDIFTYANEKLCEGNDAGMFVTAWIGFINLKTGLLSFANAGHNPPVIKRNNGEFEYLKVRPGFVLAGMSGIKYKKNELQLEPGDKIYLYTDGVTEAMNIENELYGEDRLLSVLNKIKDGEVESICKNVKDDMDKFVAEADQFDDITMLAFKYKGDVNDERTKD